MSGKTGNGSGTRPVAPAKLSHAVLRTTRLKEMVQWYQTVLNAEVLYQNLGDPKFRPCHLLRRYVEAGWLGRKTGHGFYRYETSGERHEATSHRT